MRAGLVQWGIALFMVLGLALGCGKKGPPFIPKNVIHLRVEGLIARWAEDGVELKGIVVGPETEKKQLGGHLRLRIFHARYAPSQRPCASCPIPYQGYVDRPCGIEKQGNFSCFLSLKKDKGIYFFQVAVIAPTGKSGPLSEKAILIVE